LYNIGLMTAVWLKLAATKAKNTLLCLTVYVHNLFYYYILKHNGMSSTKKIPIHTLICIHKLTFIHAYSTCTIK